MLSLYLDFVSRLFAQSRDVWSNWDHSPIIINCLDDETKCRRNTVYIFAHDLLHYCRLARAVKPPVGSQ